MDMDPSPPLFRSDELRSIAQWAADCAERALPIFEAAAPGDTRPRQAIVAAHAFAQSGVRTERLRAAAWAAHAAAREAGDPAAAAAARAAANAAGTAYTHPIATPHQINHILSAAAYAAQALAPEVPTKELPWALAHATPEVRAVVRRLPGRAPSKGAFHQLLYALDKGLRD